MLELRLLRQRQSSACDLTQADLVANAGAREVNFTPHWEVNPISAGQLRFGAMRDHLQFSSLDGNAFVLGLAQAGAARAEVYDRDILGLRPAQVCSRRSHTHTLYSLREEPSLLRQFSNVCRLLLQWEGSVLVEGHKLYGLSSKLSLDSHITPRHINPLDFRQLARPTHQYSRNKDAAFTRVTCSD